MQLHCTSNVLLLSCACKLICVSITKAEWIWLSPLTNHSCLLPLIHQLTVTRLLWVLVLQTTYVLTGCVVDLWCLGLIFRSSTGTINIQVTDRHLITVLLEYKMPAFLCGLISIWQFNNCNSWIYKLITITYWAYCM